MGNKCKGWMNPKTGQRQNNPNKKPRLVASGEYVNTTRIPRSKRTEKV